MNEKDTILFWTQLSMDVYGRCKLQKEHWTIVPTNPLNGNQPAWNFVNFGVAYDVGHWLDRAVSPNESRAYSRAVAELEAQGLIKAYRPHGRVTALVPTPDGLRKCFEVTEMAFSDWELDRESLLTALDAAKWGTAELRAVVVEAGEPTSQKPIPKAKKKRVGMFSMGAKGKK